MNETNPNFLCNHPARAIASCSSSCECEMKISAFIRGNQLAFILLPFRDPSGHRKEFNVLSICLLCSDKKSSFGSFKSERPPKKPTSLFNDKLNPLYMIITSFFLQSYSFKIRKTRKTVKNSHDSRSNYIICLLRNQETQKVHPTFEMMHQLPEERFQKCTYHQPQPPTRALRTRVRCFSFFAFTIRL